MGRSDQRGKWAFVGGGEGGRKKFVRLSGCPLCEGWVGGWVASSTSLGLDWATRCTSYCTTKNINLGKKCNRNNNC